MPNPPFVILQRGVHMVDWSVRFPEYMQSRYQLAFHPMLPTAYVGANYDRWHTRSTMLITECAVNGVRLECMAEAVVELLLVRTRGSSSNV